MNPHKKNIQGCLAGSALAGAMGTGAITDDTQMALFTAEGLILSKVRSEYLENGNISEAVYHSLLRWLYTQQVHMLGSLIKAHGSCSVVDGILMGHKELFDLRDPSGTCLESLNAGKMGTLEYLPNASGGAGAIARNIPVGIAFKEGGIAFQTACECAAITHGHPSAILSAGFLSCLISEIINGTPQEKALENSMALLKTHKNHEEVIETIYQAQNLSMRMKPAALSMKDFFPDRSAIHVLGAGLFFVLAFGTDFNTCLRMAIEQSITTESCEVAGGLLGAIHGIDAIPAAQFADLELNAVIQELAEDIFNHYHLQT